MTDENMNNIEKPTFERLGTRFQENLCTVILDDSVFASQIFEVLDVGFLELKYLRLFVQKVLDYRKKYGVHPSRDTTGMILRNDIAGESEVVQKQVREYFARITISDISIDGAEHIKDTALDFCRKQKLKEAMIKSVELIKSSSYDEVSKVINDALKLGTDNNHGYDYIVDFERRFELKARNPCSTGWDLVDNITKGGLGKGELGVIIAPTGCHAAGTKILMLDGTIKNVEDVVVGDMLIGPDSKARNVTALHSGTEVMHKITPVKGEAFTVNAGHILSLRNTSTNAIVNISVSEYLGKSKTFKHEHKLYRSGEIEFSGGKEMPYAYFLGIMLGDGSLRKTRIDITTADVEILKEVQSLSKELGMLNPLRAYTKENNKATTHAMSYSKKTELYKFFDGYGLVGKTSGDKYIPQEYKTASVEARKQVLAGLLDTDGSMSSNGYDFISKSEQLSNDVTYISRSLGLAAYVKKCKKSCQTGAVGTYYRVSISGDTNIIPCKLARKQASPRKQVKNVLNTGFSVQELSPDAYYGFEVDSDSLYLMGDFTVTHNSGKSMALVHIGAAALRLGKNVVHYTLELQDSVVATRYDSCITGIGLSDVMSQKEHIFEAVQDIKGKLIVKEYPTKSASTMTIRSHLDKLKTKGHKIDMVIIDYGDLLRPVTKDREKRQELESIYEEMRGIAQMYECCVWTASQTNRTGLNAEVITMESISEAFNKCFVADLICTISRTIKDKAANEGRMYIAKNRNGPDGMVYPLFMDTRNVCIKVLQESGESASEIIAKSAKDQEASLKEKYKAFKKEKKTT